MVVAGCNIGGSVRTVFVVPSTAIADYDESPAARNRVQSALEQTELGPFDRPARFAGPAGIATLPAFCR